MTNIKIETSNLLRTQDALPAVLFAPNTVLRPLLQKARAEVGVGDGYTTRGQSKLVQKGPDEPLYATLV